MTWREWGITIGAWVGLAAILIALLLGVFTVVDRLYRKFRGGS